MSWAHRTSIVDQFSSAVSARHREAGPQHKPLLDRVVVVACEAARPATAISLYRAAIDAEEPLPARALEHSPFRLPAAAALPPMPLLMPPACRVHFLSSPSTPFALQTAAPRWAAASPTSFCGREPLWWRRCGMSRRWTSYCATARVRGRAAQPAAWWGTYQQQRCGRVACVIADDQSPACQPTNAPHTCPGRAGVPTASLHPLIADLSSEDGCASFVNQVLERHGGIDHAVSCFGSFWQGGECWGRGLGRPVHGRCGRVGKEGAMLHAPGHGGSEATRHVHAASLHGSSLAGQLANQLLAAFSAHASFSWPHHLATPPSVMCRPADRPASGGVFCHAARLPHLPLPFCQVHAASAQAVPSQQLPVCVRGRRWDRCPPPCCCCCCCCCCAANPACMV